MPKKSKKSLSKRVKLKDKFKVIRKVKEHSRKQRKQAKQNSKQKPSVLRDPGIPANFPYREQVVKELQFEHQRILAQAAARKQGAKRKRQAEVVDVIEESVMSSDDDGDGSLSAMRMAAEAGQEEHDKRDHLTTSGHKLRASGNAQRFYREFKKVVASADVILQVLDARDPGSCRCPDIERFVRQVDPNKKIILVLNKIDLIPPSAARMWLKFLREELPAVAFKAATKNSGQIGHKPMAISDQEELLDTRECLGAETLLQLLKNYARNKDIKTAITVGVVGLPNVGKSSLINSLKRTRVSNVGNMPGVTQSVQQVHLDKHIRLLDSPGLVTTSVCDDAAAVLYSGTQMEKLSDPVAAVAAVVAKVSLARGRVKRGGSPDVEAAARIILSDWRDGKLPFHTLPPSRGNEVYESATVVSDYSREFDISAVIAQEEHLVLSKLEQEQASLVQPQHVENPGIYPEQSSEMETQEDKEVHGVHAEIYSQGKLLYSEYGQKNPSTAKAAKKRARKANKQEPA